MGRQLETGECLPVQQRVLQLCPSPGHYSQDPGKSIRALPLNSPSPRAAQPSEKEVLAEVKKQHLEVQVQLKCKQRRRQALTKGTELAAVMGRTGAGICLQILREGPWFLKKRVVLGKGEECEGGKNQKE